MEKLDSLPPAPTSFWRSPRFRYALLAGIITAGFLLVLWRGGVFTPARLRLNDVYYAPAPITDHIVIVAADDESLERYGSVPAQWSRDVHADWINRLAETNVRVVAIDFLFSEPEAEDAALAAALANLRQNEARTRIVLASAGLNSVAGDVNPEAHELTFTVDLPLSETIIANANYQGYANALPDVDGIVRRLPSLIRVDDTVKYAFSIATYLAYLRIPADAAPQVIRTDASYLSITDQRRMQVDEYGFWQPYYYGSAASPTETTFPIIALVDVVEGNFDPAFFDGKIALVGLINSTGTLDQYQVPSSTSGGLMAGIEIQANAIETLIQNNAVESLPDGFQAVIISALAVFASLLYARPRWYLKIGLALVCMLLWFVGTSVFFSLTHITVNLFDTLLALTIPLIATLGIDITLETWRRQQKEFLLDSLKRLAEQRLRLAQAAEYILEDVERIAPGSVATLYIRDNLDEDTFQRFRRGRESQTGPDVKEDPTVQRYQDTISLTRDRKMTIVPLLWHRKRQGMLAVQHSQQSALSQTAEQRLHELAGQLAPNIENMLLYDEVDRQKSLLDSVFAESPAGIAILDSAGRIAQCNQELADLLGCSLTSAQGQCLPDMLGEKAGDETLAATMLNGLQSKTTFSIDEVTLGEKAVRIDGAPLQANALWTVIVGDITALVELSKLKTQMLRIASHDLKNPLSRIIGFAELMQMTAKLDDQGTMFLNYILKAGAEMLNIIDDILNLERLRAGKVVFEDTNLAQLVREVCARFQPDVIQKHQELDVQLGDSAIRVRADAAQISQAVSNLVGNAIKYTPDAGNIIVRLNRQAGRVRFEVIDTGYGIPEYAQEKLFTEFYRAKSDATIDIPGTGLGLSLVKSVIEAHGGDIGFTSTEGVGSTFYFTLPGIEHDSE